MSALLVKRVARCLNNHSSNIGWSQTVARWIRLCFCLTPPVCADRLNIKYINSVNYINLGSMLTDLPKYPPCCSARGRSFEALFQGWRALRSDSGGQCPWLSLLTDFKTVTEQEKSDE